MSLLYNTSFKHQEGEFRKNQEYLELNHYHHHQDQHRHNSGLTRYRSAPCSFLDNLLDVTTSHGGGGGSSGDESERPSSPEIDAILSRFMSTCNGSADPNSQNMEKYGERTSVKLEMEGPQRVSQSLGLNVDNYMDSSFNVMNSMAVKNSMQETKMCTVHGSSNLFRQHSSPAGLFSNLGVDTGFTITKDSGGFRVGNCLEGESNPSSSRLQNRSSLSSGQRVMPQIDENGDDNPGDISPEGRNGKRKYVNCAEDTWDDSSPNMFSSFNIFENQNGPSGNPPIQMTHHLSLPKAAAETATVQKYLQFQRPLPCKIRAKRGFATHPRSIAERVRRTRISERIRKLQDLFPNIEKHTNTADMLDLVVQYIKDLQKQVKTLKDTKSKCTCSSTQKLHAPA